MYAFAQKMVFPSRVLVVDDQYENREIHAAILDGEGSPVATASSAPHAVEYCLHHPSCEVVVTDLHMPRMSGAELTRLLKQLRPAPKVVIVSAEKLTGRDVARMGADGYLQKPVDPLALIAQVRQLLSR